MATKTDPKSILSDKLRGMMVISGLQGLGKSTYAFTAEHPLKTFVMDYDLKGQDMAKEYGIKHYHAPFEIIDPNDPTNYDASKLADWSIALIKSVPEGITCFVIDNATALEAGLGTIVAKDPQRYGVKPGNVASGSYGGVNPGVTVLWQQIYSFLQQKGVKTVIMVNHMTQPWAGGAPVPNRFHIKGNKIFRNLSIGTFIFTPGVANRGGTPPLPSALVIKEATAIRSWDEGKSEFSTKRAWPTRFPIADRSHITNYFKTPADFSNPAVGETWTTKEVSAYGEFLSEDQLEWIKQAGTIDYNEDGGTGESKPETPAQGRARLLKELPKYKSMDELATAVKSLKMTYSLSDHDAIKAKLQALP